MLNRNEKLLHHIDPANQIGVEIGPLTTPIVTREMGSVYYIDHATTDELRTKYTDEKYAEGMVDINKIVDVDYVWGEKSLVELTQEIAPFDYLIASHIIEHVPDLIGWFNEVRSILKVGGILSLAIPDKRQCFDYKRQLTRLCDILEPYLCGSKRPKPSQIFDYYASFVTFQQNIAWNGKVGNLAELSHRNSIVDAWNATKIAFESDDYHDIHCWVFTPTSFFRLLNELAELGLLKFEVAQFYETTGCEFFVSLRAVDQPVQPPVIQSWPEEHPQLASEISQDEIQILREELRKQEQQTRYFQEQIRAMESSKFWKIRTNWIKLKQKLGLSVQ